jgi:DNA repair protein RadA/Sms
VAKTKTLFKCSACGFETVQWLGKCPECEDWNTLEERQSEPTSSAREKGVQSLPELSETQKKRLTPLSQTVEGEPGRFVSGIKEFDRVTGGGLLEGSVTLFSGEPGAGKSTLLLQVAGGYAKSSLVLYVSAEESLGQIRSRAERLSISGDNLVVLSETNLVSILQFMREAHPGVLILDSIQAISHPDFNGTTGSVGQVRSCADLLEEVAREENITLILIGHVTKDGILAGPKTLEHLVDTVLSFEGDRYQNLRTLRSNKNRNGSTGEMGLFEMTEKGLEEVENPSLFFMGEDFKAPGRAVVPIMEGQRPLLVEIQALVTPSAYPNPVRRFTGVDLAQAGLLVAVIEKNLKLDLSKQDIFLKVSGGLMVREPAADLGIVLAIISSFLAKELPGGVAVVGELGLGGEVKPIRGLEIRIKECARLGISQVIVADQGRQALQKMPKSIIITPVKTLAEAYQSLIKD